MDNNIKYRIGIIGSENSHAGGFSKEFNVAGRDGKFAFPGFRVTHIGGHYPEESEKVAAEYGIGTVVGDPSEMLGKVDAVMVTARDGKYHAGFARPFVEAGVPAFVDKPFTVSVDDAEGLIRLAKSKGVPLCGGSSLKFAYDALILRNAVAEAGDRVQGGTVTAPLAPGSPYSGFYFYSPHLAEITLTVFGYRPLSATARENRGAVTAIIDYGAFSVANHFIGGFSAYSAAVFTDRPHYREFDISMAGKLECAAFANMVRTGEMPNTYGELAAPVYYLRAVEEAYLTGKTVEIGLP